MLTHRDAKKTLPKPKVGDFCSIAMEQGFSDACVAICMDETPVARLAQSCRAAAVEMPRPTVRRWCEHGYRTAFDKTVVDLQHHFKPDGPADQKAKAQQDQRDLRTSERNEQAAKAQAAREEAAATATAAAAAAAAKKEQSSAPKDAAPAATTPDTATTTATAAKAATKTTSAKAAAVASEETKAAATPAEPVPVERVVHATISVTIDDNNEAKLVVYEGQSAEEAVMEFCQVNAADDVSACIRQLLPVVIEKLGD